MNMQQRAPLQWQVVREVKSEGSDIVVEVSRAFTDRGEPLFSLRIGKSMEKDGATICVPFIRMLRDRSLTEVRLQSPVSAVLLPLLESAEAFILAEMRQHQEAYLEQRREHEMRQSEYGRAPTRRTGKTARNRERRRNRDAEG